jgi:hypothetical protein
MSVVCGRWAFWATTAGGVVAVAGCLNPDAQDADVDGLRDSLVVHVYGPSAEPLAFASVLAIGNGTPLAVFSTNASGAVNLTGLPEAATHLRFSAPGYAAKTFDILVVPPEVFLERIPKEAAAPGPVVPVLSFLEPVPLTCPTGPATAAQDAAFGRGCGGFGEPQVEVAGDGTVWASAVCCVGRSPPIWRSFDGGHTFEILEGEATGVVRDAFGIEGDFAIDDAGNVYFFDISLATSWFTSYAADGTHRHTVPHVFEPVVDRPWVRAGVEDEVFIVYNRAGSTQFYRSVDGGLTFDIPNGQNFPCGLGGFGQGPDRNLLMVGTNCGPELYISTDGGDTWSDAEPFPVPKGDFPNGSIIDNYVQPSADDAGNIYATFTHAIDAESKQVAVFVSRRDADGTWHGPFQVSPPGIAEKPWPVAGKEGRYGVAFYYTNHTDYQDQEGAEWYLMSAASIDAHAATPHFQLVRADPEPVLLGAFGRNLGDFLQARTGPGGEMVVVYARGAYTDGLQNLFVQSDGVLDLTWADFLNGPRAG